MGKTTLIDRFRRGEPEDLCAAIGLHQIEKWEFRDVSRFFSKPLEGQKIPDQLVLHFDIYAHVHARPGFSVIRELSCGYREITALTLTCNHNVLLERLQLRKRIMFPWSPSGMWQRICHFQKTRSRERIFNRKQSFYEHPENLDALYEVWLSFWNSFPQTSHVHVDCNSEQLTFDEIERPDSEQTKPFENLILELNPRFERVCQKWPGTKIAKAA